MWCYITGVSSSVINSFINFPGFIWPSIPPGEWPRTQPFQLVKLHSSTIHVSLWAVIYGACSYIVYFIVLACCCLEILEFCASCNIWRSIECRWKINQVTSAGLYQVSLKIHMRWTDNIKHRKCKKIILSRPQEITRISRGCKKK